MMAINNLLNTVAARIEAPKKQLCRPGVKGFGDHLASYVLSVDARTSSFRQCFEHIISARLELAVLGNDYNTIKTLLLFENSRSLGKTPQSLRGQSLTTIEKKGSYCQLFRLLYSAYFTDADSSHEYCLTLSEDGFWIRKIEYFAQTESIKVHHASDHEIPALLEYLGYLWDSVLSSPTTTLAAKDLARFEWLFFCSNITGLAAASIGNCLSLILQIALDISFSEGFENSDWYALAMPLENYLEWRVNTMKKFFRL